MQFTFPVASSFSSTRWHSYTGKGTLRVGEQRTGVAGVRSAVMAVFKPNRQHRAAPLRVEGVEAAQPISLDFLDLGDRVLQQRSSRITAAHAQLWAEIVDLPNAVAAS
jgi:hypothetical protein